MIISEAIESSHELNPAPGSDDPDNFIVIEFLVLDCFVKNISLLVRQSRVNLFSFVPECAHQRHQQLADVAGGVVGDVFFEGALVASLVSTAHQQ